MITIKNKEYTIHHMSGGSVSTCGCDNGRTAFILVPYGTRLSEDDVSYTDYDESDCYLVGETQPVTVIEWADPYICNAHS